MPRGEGEVTERTIRCPWCGAPHAASAIACPLTGRPLHVQPRTSPARCSVPQGLADPGVVAPPPGSAAPDRVGGPDDEALLGRRYRVRRVVGAGSAATVYEAEQLDNGRIVAIKVLAHDMLKAGVSLARFERETRITASLSHANICRLYDCGTLTDGRPFYVMDLLDGVPLSVRIKARGALGRAEALDIVIQLLAGLRVAHSAGVVHRDIKPENVFLHRSGDGREVVKLLDFGVCADHSGQIASLEDTTRITRVNAFLGSPFYMAPEQIHNAGDVDARADLWSAGVVLYECLTAVRPFTATSLPLLLVKIAGEPHRKLSDVDPSMGRDLAAIVDKALQKDPASRYKDAATFLRDLVYTRMKLGERAWRQ